MPHQPIRQRWRAPVCAWCGEEPRAYQAPAIAVFNSAGLARRSSFASGAIISEKINFGLPAESSRIYSRHEIFVRDFRL
jgi:hypothetical protein